MGVGRARHVENNGNLVLDTLHLRCLLGIQVELLKRKFRSTSKFVTLSLQGEWERLHEITKSMSVGRTEKRPKTGALGHRIVRRLCQMEESAKESANEWPGWDEKKIRKLCHGSDMIRVFKEPSQF